jgi:saccharopine dehydrogenase (NADP+, L-glutamate forming)
MIHWCGTGLSAVPGLRRLIGSGRDITVWSLPRQVALDAVGDLTERIEEFDEEAFAAALSPGDLIVSMVPAEGHLALASHALAARAHFVSSSYITAAMRALDEEAREAGSVILGEVGLDPGIDHLMAHWLMADYRASPSFRAGNALSFHSWCGGIPREPNPLRYKFSWSPLGALRALAQPARAIRHFTELAVARPWDALRTVTLPLDPPELFEVYPNRDSLPYLADYGFEPGWKVKEFERGTLRPLGWAEAWAPVFAEIAGAEGAEGEARLERLAAELWSGNAYAPGEADRVVLMVELEAEHEGRAVYRKAWVLDAWGDLRGSAMARLVSGTVALAAEAVLKREIPVGVHGAPSDPRLVVRWLGEIEHLAQRCRVVDRLRL